MESILDWSNERLTMSLLIPVYKWSKGEYHYIKHSRLINDCYFEGKTLFVDVNLNSGKDVLTFNYNDESVGFFSGGLRRLLSIDNLILIRHIMLNSGFSPEMKEILQRHFK